MVDSSPNDTVAAVRAGERTDTLDASFRHEARQIEGAGVDASSHLEQQTARSESELSQRVVEGIERLHAVETAAQAKLGETERAAEQHLAGTTTQLSTALASSYEQQRAEIEHRSNQSLEHLLALANADEATVRSGVAGAEQALAGTAEHAEHGLSDAQMAHSSSLAESYVNARTALARRAEQASEAFAALEDRATEEISSHGQAALGALRTAAESAANKLNSAESGGLERVSRTHLDACQRLDQQASIAAQQQEARGRAVGAQVAQAARSALLALQHERSLALSSVGTTAGKSLALIRDAVTRDAAALQSRGRQTFERLTVASERSSHELEQRAHAASDAVASARGAAAAELSRAQQAAGNELHAAAARVTAVVNAAHAASSQVQSAAQAGESQVVSAAQSGVEMISAQVAQVQAHFQSLANQIGAALEEAASAAGEAVDAAVEGSGATVGDRIQNALAELRSRFEGASGALATTVTDASTRLSAATDDALSTVRDATDHASSTIETAFGTASDALGQAVETAQSQVSQAFDAAQNLIGQSAADSGPAPSPVDFSDDKPPVIGTIEQSAAEHPGEDSDVKLDEGVAAEVSEDVPKWTPVESLRHVLFGALKEGAALTEAATGPVGIARGALTFTSGLYEMKAGVQGALGFTDAAQGSWEKSEEAGHLESEVAGFVATSMAKMAGAGLDTAAALGDVAKGVDDFAALRRAFASGFNATDEAAGALKAEVSSPEFTELRQNAENVGNFVHEGMDTFSRIRTEVTPTDPMSGTE